ncbi:GD15074 [Drosophila simulans]|uniref:GD15074 n=1 Tax=Drosophila simulans TaxID=7240 RepID=B4NTH8_DROSI|nr:GD15074 [Drosophila simulans]
MLCEDQHMSVENTPQKGSGSLNSSASSISIDMKPTMQSWAQEVRAEFGHSDEASSSLNSSAVSCGSLAKKETSDGNLECKEGEGREMAFEFLDGVNEVKFERLVKEEKLKTPYKRRHSFTPPSNENSRSNSPNSSNSSANGDAAAPKGGNNQHSRNANKSGYSGPTRRETADPAILSRRQKQIDYGKNTAAYERYVEMVPKAERTRDHPRTPNKHGKYSRRAFDGLVKIWRKSLHIYDPPTQARGTAKDSNSDSDSD